MADEKLHEFPETREEDLDPAFVAVCKAVTAHRPRLVIDHILKHGYITTEELTQVYGYNHPPRAARDVRESGVPLKTHRFTSAKSGRKLGAYTFGDLKEIIRGRIEGRRALPKKFKGDLVQYYGAREAFTGERLDPRYLQVDHRIPYEISGDPADLRVADFMLIDASSQRAKSWSCENCINFQTQRSVEICKKCFWAFPETYEHIAMEQKRRVDIIWSSDETKNYESAAEKAALAGLTLQDHIKQLLSK